MQRLLRVLLLAVAVVAVAGAGVAVWLRDWSGLTTFGLLAAVTVVTNWSLTRARSRQDSSAEAVLEWPRHRVHAHLTECGLALAAHPDRTAAVKALRQADPRLT